MGFFYDDRPHKGTAPRAGFAAAIGDAILFFKYLAVASAVAVPVLYALGVRI